MMIFVMLYHNFLHYTHTLTVSRQNNTFPTYGRYWLYEATIQRPALKIQIISKFKMTISRFLVETEGQ